MESSKEIQIKVKTLNSTTIPFKIYTHETVGGLKNKIFQKIRISTLNQRLIYQGKVLKNHFNCIELENGIILESHNDGRYYDDNDNYEEVILWNEEEEKGLGIGYIKV